MNDRNIWLTFKPPNQIKLVNKKNMETSQTHLASKKSVVLKCQFAMGLKFDDLENKGKNKNKTKTKPYSEWKC